MARKYREPVEDDAEADVPVQNCWLCLRPIGQVTEWHHPIPKSRGGKIKQPVHPICHQAIHANLSNSELEKRYSTPEALLAHAEIGRFVAWVATKPPDFHAPTKERR
jgi:hypothetical protein